MLNSFDSRELAFLDPIHEISWATVFVSNFFNFVIKERPLSFLDHIFEVMPVFKTLRKTIFFK